MPGVRYWVKVFTREYPMAKPIVPEGERVALTTGADHASASINWTFHNYPSRFRDDPNPLAVAAIKGKMGAILVHIPRELIEEDNISSIAEILQDMVATREQLIAHTRRVSVVVTGFDDDPRDLWHIPHARDYLRRLFLECPFVMVLSHPDGSLLKLLAACWVYEYDSSEAAERYRTTEFLERAFEGLNQLTHQLALSEELNREICMAAMKALFTSLPTCHDVNDSNDVGT